MMTKKLLSVSFFAFATIGLFLVFVGQARANDTTKLSISPLTFDLSANPGDVVTKEILVRNSGTEAVTVTIASQDFVATGEEGQVGLTDNQSTFSLSSWVEIEDAQFTLAGAQQKWAKFVIRVPLNAEPGGHYASVFAHLIPSVGETTSGSGVDQKIGSLVLLRVAGDVKESANVETFDTTKPFYEKGPVGFDIRIKNNGSTHIKPKGIIAITDMFGKKVADISVDQKNIIPGVIRHSTAEWAKNTPPGKYTATLLTYYGGENKRLNATTTFWIIPWKLMLLWASVIIVIIVTLYLLRGRIKSAVRAFVKHK